MGRSAYWVGVFLRTKITGDSSSADVKMAITSLPILTTKLFIPPLLPSFIVRQRLFDRLNEGLQRKLTLISAPVGFGKTTLAAAWIQNAGSAKPGQTPPSAIANRRLAWLSLDENDNDPTLFLMYLTAALQSVDDTLGETVIPILQSQQTPSFQVIMGALINELARMADSLVLVLDDYHVIENPAVHDSLAYLLAYQPPQLHLVIVTRVDPPLSLARLRARRQMTEIRADDLRFTTDEAAAFLRQVWELEILPEHVDALEARTEGWIAGLQLAALSLQSLQSQQEIADFVTAFTGSHRYILDYLVDEVLHQQPPAIQDFLLRSAILDRLCADLCHAVLEMPDAQIILETLEADNLFLTPLDERRHWYRYHHLFADLLRHRLKQTQPELIPMLHGRASHWYEAHDFIDASIRHALAAGDETRAARLVEKERWSLRNRGDVTTLHRWLDLLPPEVIDASGPLAMGRASTLMYAGKMAETEAYLARVLPALLEQPSADQDWQVELAVLQGQIALNHGRFSDALAYCLQAHKATPPEQTRFLGAVEHMLGHAHRALGNVEAAASAYTAAAQIAIYSENRFTHFSDRSWSEGVSAGRGSRGLRKSVGY